MSSVFGARSQIIAQIDRRLRNIRFTLTSEEFWDLPKAAIQDMQDEMDRLKSMRRDLVPPRDYYGDMLLQSYA